MYSYSQFMRGTDRYQVQGGDDAQLDHIVSKLKYPIEDILRAVQEVGFDRDEVEEYIRDRYNRC